MILKAPISLKNFFSMMTDSSSDPKFELNDLLLNSEKDLNEPYGFTLIRKAIKSFEDERHVEAQESKQQLQFFRDNQLRLIGPDLIPFSLSFYEESSCFVPTEPCLFFYFDMDDLIDLCLDENITLTNCKYEPADGVAQLQEMLNIEYDKIYADKENTGFLIGSKFVPLLYKALIEYRPFEEKGNREWRMSCLQAPEVSDYIWDTTTFRAVKQIRFPLSFVKRIEVYPDFKQNPALYTNVIGLMKKKWPNPEQLLVGLIED